MKLKFFPLFKDEGEVVAGWGQAQLIKYLDGKVWLDFPYYNSYHIANRS